MNETPLNNSPEARTETGELKGVPLPTETKVDGAGTTEAKPEGEQSLLNETEGEVKVEAPKAPDAYTDFTVPEGQTLDKEAIAAATPLFKEHNLTQEAAQKFVDFHNAQMKATVDKLFQGYADTRKAWADETKAHFGTRLPEVKATIGRALDLLPPETRAGFREIMNSTGAGDNPFFAKAFYDLAQRATEGRPVVGKGPSPEGQRPTAQPRPSAAAALFPNLPSATPQ